MLLSLSHSLCSLLCGWVVVRLSLGARGRNGRIVTMDECIGRLTRVEWKEGGVGSYEE